MKGDVHMFRDLSYSYVFVGVFSDEELIREVIFNTLNMFPCSDCARPMLIEN